MAPTSKACFHALLACLVLSNTFAAKPPGKIRLEDIENENNKRAQDLSGQKTQEAVAKAPQAAQQGGILPHQYFQFGQQPVADYAAALQGAAHPQLYLGQHDQLALLEALGQHPSGFAVSPFHGLYGNAAGQGIPNTGAYPFGHFRAGAAAPNLPPTSQGAYALPPTAFYGQNERAQIDAKLAPQQAVAPQLQYQQIQLQQQSAQQLLKTQPQIPQQYQQQIAQPQYVFASPAKQERQQQVSIPQKQIAPQQQFYQLPQYLQQLTQHPQYIQQVQAIQQQAQAQALSALQENTKFQPSQEVRQGHPGASQQYFQPTPQPIAQPERQQYLQSTPQPYLQQSQQQLIQVVPHQYLQHQQYLQPAQQQYLQAAQQGLPDSRPVFQQPFIYQEGASQSQKAAIQSLSGGNQVLVGVGGNQLSSKQAALAVKREGSRGGARPIGAVSAFARGGYTS